MPESATFKAIQTQELDDDSLLKDTLSVIIKGDEKLLDAEYTAVKSYTGNAQALDMYRIVSDTTPDKSMSFTGMSLAPYELNGYIIQDLRPVNHSLEYTLNRVLTGTDWRLGYMDDDLPNITTTFYYVSVKEALKELQSLVGCEFVFKVEISGQKITDKWIEVYSEMGNRTKKRFNYGTNALTVVRETNKADIYTALIGRGKGEEVSSGEDNESGQAGYGRKITFDEIEWSTAKGDPLNKPKGQYYLELPQATLEYGMRNVDGTLSPRIGIVEFDDEEDPANLLRLTYEQLKVSARPKVLFKSTVANIGATGIGDTVTIHRHDLNMHYETRVRKVVRNKLNDNKTQIELGDAVVTPSTKRAKQNNATIKDLRKELERAQQEITETRLSADGKTNNHYGRVEPERKRTGDTWFRPHPSLAGELQMLTWNGDAWELIVDTSDTNRVERELEEVIKPKIEEMTTNISNADNKAKDALDKVNLNAELIEEHKNNLESLTGETIPAISKDIQDMREDLGEASKTAKSSLELIGIDRGSFYTKNRRLGAKSQTIPKGDTAEILHNGDGFEVGKVYTLSFKAECIIGDIIEWVERTRTETIAFERVVQYSDTLRPDESYVQTAGVNGQATYAWQVETVNGVETGKRTNEIRTSYSPPVNEIYIQGTKTTSTVNFTIRRKLQDLSEARIVQIGDSITMGYGRDIKIPDVVKSELGAQSVQNAGYGSTTASLHPTKPELRKIGFTKLVDSIVSGNWTEALNADLSSITYATPQTYKNSLTALSNTDFSSIDAVIIMYGTNDWAMDVKLDNSSDKYDQNTYLGALRYGINKLQQAYPHLEILVSQPILWTMGSATSETYNNGIGLKVRDYANALKTSLNMDVPVAQIYNKGITTGNYTNYFNNGDSTDGTHPNSAGNAVIGKLLASEFERLIDINPAPKTGSTVNFEIVKDGKATVNFEIKKPSTVNFNIIKGG